MIGYLLIRPTLQSIQIILTDLHLGNLGASHTFMANVYFICMGI